MAVRQIEPIDRAELRATIQKWIDAHTDVDDTDGVGLLEDVLWEINAQPTLTPPNEWLTLEFDVVDTTTGKYPDWERIAREEAWAKGLVYCDMDGIAIQEDGSLILLDECGNCVLCPPDRFEIRRPPEGEEDNND